MITVFNISFQTNPHVEPLGSEQVVDILSENGFKTQLVTSSFVGDITAEILQTAITSDYIIFAGINNVRDILDQHIAKRDELAWKIKRLGYKGKVIVMGHQVSLTPYETIANCSAIDAVIVGDTDVATIKLVELIKKAAEIKGIIVPTRGETHNWKENGLITVTKNRPYLADLCKIHPNEKLCAVVESSRGCSHSKCTFCSTAALYKACNRPQYVLKPIEDVIGEMKYIHKKFGIDKFIVEDDFAISPDSIGYDRLNQLNKALETLDFKAEFSLVLRADCITPESREMFERLRDNGLKLLYLGIESFNERDLELYGKHISLSSLLLGVDIAQSLGFQMDVSGKYRIKPGLMPFHPYAELESIREQSKYLYKYSITPVKMIAEVELYLGTPLYAKAAKDSLLAPGTRSGFKYKNENTATFHYYAKEMLKTFHKLRKRIRNVEKTIYGFDLELEDTVEIRSIRIDLENMFGTYYSNLLDECIKGSSKHDLDKLLDGFKTTISNYVDELDATQKVDKAWIKTIDILRYWYGDLNQNIDPLFFRPCYFPVVH